MYKWTFFSHDTLVVHWAEVQLINKYNLFLYDEVRLTEWEEIIERNHEPGVHLAFEFWHLEMLLRVHLLQKSLDDHLCCWGRPIGTPLFRSVKP